MTQVNPIHIALISLHSEWTEEQREYCKLAPRKYALEMLITITGVNHGYSIRHWTWHLIRYRRDFVGLGILFSLITGRLKRQIEAGTQRAKTRIYELENGLVESNLPISKNE